MYIYHFSKYAGTDRIFFTEQEMGAVGDLVVLGKDEYVLVLGEDIAWKEQVKKYALPTMSTAILPLSLLWEHTIQLLHRFVNERYTTYKHSIPLWLHDIEDIYKRQDVIKKGTKKKNKKYMSQTWKVVDGVCVQGDEQLVWQQLIVFPDIWTLEQHVGRCWSSLPVWACILHGKSTKKQKTEAFWWIKYGTISTLFCTYSQIFQDRHDLSHIILVDRHTRYYKNQQDPRYYVPTVVAKMAEVYAAELVTIGVMVDT